MQFFQCIHFFQFVRIFSICPFFQFVRLFSICPFFSIYHDWPLLTSENFPFPQLQLSNSQVSNELGVRSFLCSPISSGQSRMITYFYCTSDNVTLTKCTETKRHFTLYGEFAGCICVSGEQTQENCKRAFKRRSFV